MSNHRNYRRGEESRTENGPRYESPNPGQGCNSTHVARSRSWWKRYRHRAERRTEGPARGFHYNGRGRPPVRETEALS